MYQIIYKIEIIKEYLAGVIADYFRYEDEHELSDELKSNFNRLKEIYGSIIFVNDMDTLNKLEKEIKEYKKDIDEL